jgi:hypothetical protein
MNGGMGSRTATIRGKRLKFACVIQRSPTIFTKQSMANACISLAGAFQNHLKLVLVAPEGASVSVFAARCCINLY